MSRTRWVLAGVLLLGALTLILQTALTSKPADLAARSDGAHGPARGAVPIREPSASGGPEREPTRSDAAAASRARREDGALIVVSVEDPRDHGIGEASVAVRSDDGEPVGPRVRCDTDGHCTVGVESEGEYRVTAWDPAGAPLGSTSVYVDRLDGREFQARIECSPCGEFVGRVEGSRSTAAWVDLWVGSSLSLLARTPDDSIRVEPGGDFRFPSCAESLVLRARAPDRIGVDVAVARASPGTTSSIQLSLSAGRVVNGAIRTESGSAVPGAHIRAGAAAGFGRASDSAESSWRRESGVHVVTRSGPSGRFSLGALPRDAIPLLVEADGFLPRRVWIGAADREVSVVLSRGESLAGEVVSPAGDPIESAQVVLLGSNVGKRTTTTDGRGRFRFDGLPGNPEPCREDPPYLLAAWGSGFTPGAVDLSSLSESPALVLDQARGPLSGRLVVPEGREITEYELSLVSADPRRVCGWPPADLFELFGLRSISVSPDGSFGSPVASDARAWIEVHRGPALVGRHDVREDPLELVLPATSRYRGRVVTTDGTPIREFRVVVWPEEGGSDGAVTRGRALPFESSDGEFSIEARKGTSGVRVTVRAVGFSPQDIVLAGEWTEVVLRHLTDVEVRLVRSDGRPWEGTARVKLVNPETGAPLPCVDRQGVASVSVPARGGRAFLGSVPVGGVVVTAMLGEEQPRQVSHPVLLERVARQEVELLVP